MRLAPRHADVFATAVLQQVDSQDTDLLEA